MGNTSACSDNTSDNTSSLYWTPHAWSGTVCGACQDGDPRSWRCKIPTVVDLFAGCGGLGLGLEQAGFETLFVNELNHDAMSTYLLNRQGKGLDDPKNHSNDITELTAKEGELEALADRLHREHGDVTLVAGGPPCQGFSGIGHRRTFDLNRTDIPSNHLYAHMARVVQTIAPKAFLFENVRGLLNARWTKEGEKGEIWEDVQDAFRQISVRKDGKVLEYDIRPQLVFAKDYGVPQNRPRVLMVGIRSDITPTLTGSKTANGFLPDGLGEAPDLVDLLGDLVDPNWEPGGSTKYYLTDPLNDVQRQLRTGLDGKVLGKGDVLTEQEYGKHRPEMIAKFQYMIDHNGEIPEAMRTKKFAQRVFPQVWGPTGPSITATSLPDDYVHFSQPRVPTVREWARLQTFPDWYQFAGKRTTGGRRRAGDPSIGQWARDVPRFTQIGNAVPVKLGEAVGLHIRELLGE